jgi:hypothetical protein
MNISAEKAQVLQRVEKVNDIALIRAIKNLLDFGLTRQEENEAMENAINIGLSQSKSGQTRAHNEVMSELKSKFRS